jgi:hypothetical protein
MIQF